MNSPSHLHNTRRRYMHPEGFEPAISSSRGRRPTPWTGRPPGSTRNVINRIVTFSRPIVPSWASHNVCTVRVVHPWLRCCWPCQTGSVLMWGDTYTKSDSVHCYLFVRKAHNWRRKEMNAALVYRSFNLLRRKKCEYRILFFF